MSVELDPITGARQVCEELHRHGVTEVFGLMGDGNVQWIPLLAEYGITYRASRHEAGAVAMADAYSRVTGRVGVCTVTHGPGLTHALSCMVEARKARSSVVLVAGETPTRQTAYSCQDLDHAAVLRSIGCESVRIRVVGTVARDMARALARSEEEQQPIGVLLPTDVQSATCRYAPVEIAPAMRRAEPDDSSVSAIAEMLEEARRPLIIAGRGALRAQAGPTIEAVAERADALLGTTVLAKGLFAKNPFSLDVIGGFSTTTAKRLVRECDLVVGFGTSLSTWTTLAGSLFTGAAKIVQVSDEAAALGAHAPVDLGLVADAKATAQALVTKLAGGGPKASWVRTDDLAQEIANGRTEFTQDESTDTLIDPRVVMYRINELLPEDRTIAIDGGWHQVLPVRLLRSTDGRGFVFLQTYQAVGPGMSAAIGAAVGRPERVSAIVLGDGALGMSLGELETATRLGLRIVVIVINDDGYHAEVHGLNDIGQPTDTAYHGDVDFAAIARALGGRGVTVRTVADLEQGLSTWLTGGDGPLVLDCKVPCPLGYWDDQEWLEDFWHEPRHQVEERSSV